MATRSVLKDLDTVKMQNATQDISKKSLNQILPNESAEKSETFSSVGQLAMMKNEVQRIAEPDDEKYLLDEFDLEQDIDDVDEFDLLENIDLDQQSQHHDASKKSPGKGAAKVKTSKTTKKQIDLDLEEQQKQKEITQEFIEFLNKKQKNVLPQNALRSLTPQQKPQNDEKKVLNVQKESDTGIQKGKVRNGKAVSTRVQLRRKIDKQLKNIDEVPAVAQVQPLAMLIDFVEVRTLAPAITEEQIQQLKQQFSSAPRRTVVKIRNILDQAKEEESQQVDSQMSANNQQKGEALPIVMQRSQALSEASLPQSEAKLGGTKDKKNFANIAKRVKQIVAKTKSKMQGVIMNKDERFDKHLEVFKGLNTFVEIKPFLAQINELNEDEQEKAHQALKQMSQKVIFQHVREEMEQLIGENADKDIESSLVEHLPVLERSYKHLDLKRSKRLNYHERATDNYYKIALQLVERQKEANTAVTTDLAADFERGFTSIFAELVMQLSTAKAEGDQGNHELNIFQQKQLELFKTVVRGVHGSNKGDQAEDQLSTVKAYEHFKQRSNKILKLLIKASKNILKKNLIETGNTIDPAHQMRILRKQEDQRKKFDDLKNKLDEYKRMKLVRQHQRNIEFLQTIRESEEGHAHVVPDDSPTDKTLNLNLTQPEGQTVLDNSVQNFLQSTMQNTPVAHTISQKQNTFILMQQLQDAQKKIDAVQNSPHSSKGYSSPVHFPSLNRQIQKPDIKNVSLTLDQSLIDRQTLERSIQHSQSKIQLLHSQSAGYLQDSIRQKSSGFSQMRLKQMLFKDLCEDNMPKQVEVFKELISESQAVQKKIQILHNLKNPENLQNNFDSVIELPKIPSNKISKSLSFSTSLIDTTARTGNFANQNSSSVHSNKRRQQQFVNTPNDILTVKINSPADSKNRSHKVSSSVNLHDKSSITMLGIPSLSQVISPGSSSKQQQHSRFFTEQVQQKPTSAKSNKIIQSIFARQKISSRKKSIKSSTNEISGQTEERLTQSRVSQEEDDSAVRARNVAHREVVQFKVGLKELFTEIKETITENKQQRAQELREIENLGSISQELFEKQREKPLESIRDFEKIQKNPLVMSSFKKKTMRSIL